MAESFGTDAQRYDQARPDYPVSLLQRIVAQAPGPDMLDVGCGTGIAARQLKSLGCNVLGVEPDARMAAVARSHGLAVDVASFEDWQSLGRTFDAVIAAQSWHWVNPAVGAVKAADVLRAGGVLAVFGHAYEPPAEVAEPFAAAYRRVVPDSPFSGQPARRPLDVYRGMYKAFADTMSQTGAFHEPEQFEVEWERTYSRDQWLELLPTTGGLTQLAPEQTTEILDAVASAIDGLGGHFTMHYVTVATAAVRGSAA